jgi:hypothetical protein
MTNGTSGDERHRRSEPDWRLAARVAVTHCGQITQFQIRKRFTASELFSGFLAPDKLQDKTAIQPRRFVAAPRHTGKDYWQVKRHAKIIAAPDLF